ncbi:MAG: 2-dehydropantoate 2-reductase [Candidatus Omnitrophica bacterium]|nr:2-dehydropantoate 2-reductase [Candidatus Omnitrophota bacterium]
MRIAIIGAGAMGCLLAGSFVKKKHSEVWLLDNDAKRTKKIQESGISVTGISGNFNVKVNITNRSRDISVCDLIIVCVKSYDTESAVKSIEPLLGEDTSVLTLQNGLGNIEMIAEICGREKVIGGVTGHGATLLSEGSIYHAGKGDTVLGRIDGRLTVAMREIRDVFNRSGFCAKLSKDIYGAIWSKLIINIGINALSAITRLPNESLIEYQQTREIMSMAVAEAVRVAKKNRIKLLYDDAIQKVESVCRATEKNLSSMLQDVLKKKKTEIDYINGAIIRQAKSLNIPVPANMILANLVKAIELEYSKQGS